MAQDKDTARWKASISVSLTPVNKYGDELNNGYNELSYTAVLDGSLLDVVARLELLKGKTCSV